MHLVVGYVDSPHLWTAEPWDDSPTRTRKVLRESADALREVCKLAGRIHQIVERAYELS